MVAQQKALRVLARPATSSSNPYNARVYGGIEAHGVQITDYSVVRALNGRFDLLHVHWPESTFNHSLAEARLATRALLVAVKTQRRRGAKLVWTMHNLRAHEQKFPEVEARFWGRFLPQVDAVIALSESSLARARTERSEVEDKPAFVVPHPHYRGCYPDEMLDRAAARRQLGLDPDRPVIAFVGQLKRYKNVPALIRVARALPEVQLLVAGKPIDGALKRELEQAAAGDPKVHLKLGFVPDDQLQYHLRAADLIALPYRDILNSGTALLGLSFDRPVWLPSEGPAGALAADLVARVGPQWVLSGPLSVEGLQSALLAAQALPERTEGAQLTAFSPEVVVEQTARALKQIAGRA